MGSANNRRHYIVTSSLISECLINPTPAFEVHQCGFQHVIQMLISIRLLRLYMSAESFLYFWSIWKIARYLDFHWVQATLPHWRRATHRCVSKLTIIGSYNGLSPGQRQAIAWTNDGVLLIAPLGTNFSEIVSKIHTFSLKKMHLKTSSAKWRPFCLGLNVLQNNRAYVLGCIMYQHESGCWYSVNN